ncbi:hypothetical protein BH11ACT6_BH11ACT6_55450 [soil metagenome]
MPAEDLLRYLGEPPVVSRWWLVLGVLGIVAVIAWCTGIHLLTRPTVKLPAALTRRRFTKSVHRIGDRYRSGAITSTEACAQLSAVVRSFLTATTGAPAEYMHISELAQSPVAEAAPLLAELTAAQFDQTIAPDVSTLERAAGELIASWN